MSHKTIFTVLALVAAGGAGRAFAGTLPGGNGTAVESPKQIVASAAPVRSRSTEQMRQEAARLDRMIESAKSGTPLDRDAIERAIQRSNQGF